MMVDNAVRSVAATPYSHPREHKLPDGGCMVQPLLTWHVASTEPGQHDLAGMSLRERGYLTIAPLVREECRLPKGKRATITKPMWPGYLLVGNAVGQDLARAYSARGVGGLLPSMGDPYRAATVRPAVVEWLLTHMTKRGVVEGRSASNREISVPELMPAIKAGETLRVESGPFVNSEGVCLWSTEERVALLLDVMGGKREVRLRRDHVAVVGG
mgnify:CR=1 FL=1